MDETVALSSNGYCHFCIFPIILFPAYLPRLNGVKEADGKKFYNIHVAILNAAVAWHDQ